MISCNVITHVHCSCSSQAGWIENLDKDADISDYAEPTSSLKRTEAYIKYNASLAATKYAPPKKWF